MLKVELQIRDSTNNVIGTLEVKNHETFPFTLTKSIASLNSFTKRSGAFSKVFRIPATKENNKLLTYLYSVNQRPVKGFREKKTAFLVIGGEIIERGYLKIEKIATANTPQEYELKFFGDNLDWISQIAEFDLTDLTYSNNNQTFDKTNIELSWIKTYADGFDLVYPLINRGQYKSGKGVKVADMRPALRYTAIIERALNKAGYILESTFLNTADFTQLIMPLGGNAFSNTSDTIDETKFRASTTSDQNITLDENVPQTPFIFDDDSTTPNLDPGNNYNTTTGQYTVPKTGLYKMWYFLDARPVSDTVCDINVALELFINGVRFRREMLGGVEMCRHRQSFNNAYGVTPEWKFLDAGDVIDWRFNHDFEHIFQHGNVPDMFFKVLSGAFWRMELHELIVAGSTTTYNLNDVFPKVNVLDLINDLTKMFNLHWQTNTFTKVVTVEPRNDFFKARSVAIDWTDILDISRTPEISFIIDYPRTLKFSYATDGKDAWMEARNKLNGNILGSYTHSLPDRFKKGVEKIQLKTIAFTAQIVDINLKDFASSFFPHCIPIISRMWNKANADSQPPLVSYDFAPRILNFKYDDQIGITDSDCASIFAQWEWEGIDSTRKIPYTATQNIEKVVSTVPMNLSWNGSDGLFATYYARAIKLIEDAVRLTVYFKLSYNEIKNLDFRIPIYISSPAEIKGYWLIEKVVDYAPTKDQSTKVELLMYKDLGVVSIDSAETVVDSTTDTDRSVDATVTTGGQTTTTDDTEVTTSTGKPGTSIGTNNEVKAGSGSVTIGKDLIANGEDQLVTGTSNKTDSESVFIVGSGTLADQETSFSVQKDGTVEIQGGEMQTIDGDGNIQNLYIEDSNNKLQPIYLKK